MKIANLGTGRKDRHLNLGFGRVHYIHYHPQVGGTRQWGVLLQRFGHFTVDVFWGRHVFVYNFHGRLK